MGGVSGLVIGLSMLPGRRKNKRRRGRERAERTSTSARRARSSSSSCVKPHLPRPQRGYCPSALRGIVVPRATIDLLASRLVAMS